VNWQSVRDDAYRLAHKARATCEAAVVEPTPLSSAAVHLIPVAIELEDVVDMMIAVASTVDAGAEPTTLVDDVEARLAAARHSAMASKQTANP
jgi:hypothetical protein